MRVTMNIATWVIAISTVKKDFILEGNKILEILTEKYGR